MQYALVTPARDESANLKRLVGCVEAQTVRPAIWCIVDDGSVDGTLDIARSFERRHEWIRALSSRGAAGGHLLPDGRRAGRDVVAFTTGLVSIGDLPDFIVKLDADVSFDVDFFERLLDRFNADPALGIGSGMCYELERGRWRPRPTTGDHVRGATRMYRRECFEQVSPLVERLGWDTVDEVRAVLCGWKTASFPDLPFRHHRPVGSRDGTRREWEAQGEVAHYLGYRFSYLTARALYRAVRQPSALVMPVSYLRCVLRRTARLDDPAVRKHVRQRQRLRGLGSRLVELHGHSSR